MLIISFSENKKCLVTLNDKEGKEEGNLVNWENKSYQHD